MKGVSALIKKIPQNSLPGEDTRSWQPQGSFSPTVPAPSSWTSSLQNCEREICAVYKLPSLWYFLKFLFYIGVQLTFYNVTSVSGAHLSDPIIHISILVQILFPYRLLQNTE